MDRDGAKLAWNCIAAWRFQWHASHSRSSAFLWARNPGAADALPGAFGMLGGAGGVDALGGGAFFFLPGRCGSPNCAEAGGTTAAKRKATARIARADLVKPMDVGKGFILIS
jgi:hypothetical protein